MYGTYLLNPGLTCAWNAAPVPVHNTFLIFGRIHPLSISGKINYLLIYKVRCQRHRKGCVHSQRERSHPRSLHSTCDKLSSAGPVGHNHMDPENALFKIQSYSSYCLYSHWIIWPYPFVLSKAVKDAKAAEAANRDANTFLKPKQGFTFYFCDEFRRKNSNQNKGK